MQIKKFRADNIKKALEKVKLELGTDAVILSAKNVPKSKANIFNNRNNQIEITAAIDYNERILNPVRENKDHIQESITDEAINPFRSSAGYRKFSTYVDDAPVSSPRNREPDNFRKNETLSKLAMLFDHMLNQHFDHDSALKIVKQLWNIYRNSHEIQNENMNLHIANILSDLGVREKMIKLKKGKRRIVAFVGKSGVGKTTSAIKVAALATRYLKSGQIGLISIVDRNTVHCHKAKTFADIIGYSHKTVHSISEFRSTVSAFKNKNLILIDTPGLIQGDNEKIEQIDQYLTLFYPMEIHMVVSANDKIENGKKNMGYFNQIPISHLLFTKLDETSTYGNILSMLINEDLPLSYFSWGPDIPENIEKGRIKKMVDVIFNVGTLKQRLNGDPESIAEVINDFEKMLVGKKAIDHLAMKSLPTRHKETIGYGRQMASNY